MVTTKAKGGERGSEWHVPVWQEISQSAAAFIMSVGRGRGMDGVIIPTGYLVLDYRVKLGRSKIWLKSRPGGYGDYGGQVV